MREYDSFNNRDVTVRFLEQRVRGEKEFECVVEAVEAGRMGLDLTCVYPLGKTWDEVKEKYPTLNDVLNTLGHMHEFGGVCVAANFNITDMDGAEGLYD